MSSHAQQADLPSPDFSGPYKFIAGIRPFRTTGYRLDVEIHGTKTIVHNYGHGGAGITMSWGCAQEVRELITSRGFDVRKSKIAVLGAGVMGLTSATLLSELGARITIYSKQFIPHTTSNVAGGQWAPSVVEYRHTHRGVQEFQRILRRAFRTHESKIGMGFGVSRRPNYFSQPSKSFALVPKDIVPEAAFSVTPSGLRSGTRWPQQLASASRVPGRWFCAATAACR